MTSPPIGTDEELIEELTRVFVQVDFGPMDDEELAKWLSRPEFAEAYRKQARAVLPIVQSRISEVERLREALEAIDKTAFIAVTTDSDETKHVAAESIHDIASAVLSQHRTTG